MVDATHISFNASDRSYFSLIKKDIHRRASDGGMPAARLNELDIILAEMTSNLFKYGQAGEILFGVFNNKGMPYVELISIDQGPGMINPSKMLLDGFSSSNTMGHGLGSIKRLSDLFELYSLPAWGTIVLSRVYYDATRWKKAPKAVIRPVIVAKPGETQSGDGMYYKETDKQLTIMIADGLGHGPEANKAVNEAAAAFRVCPDNSPTEILRFIHAAIKRTRGAVMNITCYDFEKKVWTSSGIGNIAARLNGPSEFKNHMSYNGIVGFNIPNTMSDQEYSSELYNQVILCSDGIKTRWDLTKYPSISRYDPSILAAAIYKDHARRNDDMSVVVVKIK